MDEKLCEEAKRRVLTEGEEEGFKERREKGREAIATSAIATETIQEREKKKTQSVLRIESTRGNG